jgi:type VI protein secretion system component Hcp
MRHAGLILTLVAAVLLSNAGNARTAFADPPNPMGSASTSAPATAPPAKAGEDFLLRVKGEKRTTLWSSMRVGSVTGRQQQIGGGTLGQSQHHGTTVTLERPKTLPLDNVLPASSKVIPAVEIATVRRVSGNDEISMIVTLEDVLVSSHDTSGQTEKIVMTYAKLKTQMVSPNDSHVKEGWNIKQDSKV